MAPSSQQNQSIYVGVALAATVVVLGYLVSRNRASDKGPPKLPPPSGSADSPARTKRDITETATPVVSNTSGRSGDAQKSPQNDKEVQAQIEELDKQGKKLFKEKKFFEAAQKFTEALDIIESRGSGVKDASSPLFRQMQTLMNNRSAMYEKGGFKELALDDCENILALEKQHTKARTRKLRILESQENYAAALVEACAIQLLFMQEHRDKLRFGIPTPPPPLSQSKLEELLMKLVPDEVDKKLKEIKAAPVSSRHLPSDYTILQLLKSYSGYNSWMAKVASGGGLTSLQADLPEVDEAATDETIAKRASRLLKIGQRQVYDGKYKESMASFEEAFKLAETNPEVQKVLPDDEYARLLEWTGMVRHWIYDLDGAKKCFSMCADLEPVNAQILVKQACVEMDGANFDKALSLFESALKIDPGAADALLHRANLRMLQTKPEDAKADLNKCIELRPDHVLARLRLASILTAMNDVTGAKQHLESAKKLDPKSSEVQSYIGEIAFTKGELEDAQQSFKLAMELAPNNPTPYVNAALTILNIPPPPGERPDTDEVIRLLEKAIDKDPMFHAAYVQLGQLKLGTAVTLDSAREVVSLYDTGLKYCRTAEELKDLCSMRILTVSQVEAASNLHMDTFNVQ